MTLLVLVVLLVTATLIGRLFGDCFPFRLRGAARFYLSPVLGLSTLTIIASLVGRFLPMGNTVIIPVLITALVVWALFQGKKTGAALGHASLVSAFGIFCGASILGPLFVFGAFNAHNDAFTYLVHANWLQAHAFIETITPQTVTPFTTQINLYQQLGFRMGSSFLLALVQSLLHLAWSYEVYPGVMIAAVAACCLSIGFPLTRYLHTIRRPARLALLAFPAFSLGGLVFGANLGFLPQTLGLALGAGLLFTTGPTLGWLARTGISIKHAAISAIPAIVLFASAVFAYSELAPFIVVAVGGSGLLLIFKGKQKKNLMGYMVLLFVFSGFLLNTELFRAYTALRIQSGAVVGSPVEWSLLGYGAHAMGVHGGAWDGFQWTTPEMTGSGLFVVGIISTVLVAGVLLMGWRVIGQAILRGELLPASVILLVFCALLIYFRFFVPSPFPKGVGQSWSQFKLSEWAHPFLMAFVILGSISLRQRVGRYIDVAISFFFLIGIVSAAFIGVARTTPLIQYYGGPQDLNRFYREFRQTVLSSCPPGVPIYLALNGEHHKFRQMAVYYLSDRLVTSDWMDDGYIFPWLPDEQRRQTPNPGDCVVEPNGLKGWLTHGRSFGPFCVGIFER